MVTDWILRLGSGKLHRPPRAGGRGRRPRVRRTAQGQRPDDEPSAQLIGRNQTRRCARVFPKQLWAGLETAPHHNRLVGALSRQNSRLRRSAFQHVDRKTRVQVDHRGSSVSRPTDALRISRASCSHASKSTSRAAMDSWSARKACNLASARDACRSDSLRIALRSASHFETFQRRANLSSVRTVPTSSEYVDLIVMKATHPIMGPPEYPAGSARVRSRSGGGEVRAAKSTRRGTRPANSWRRSKRSANSAK